MKKLIAAAALLTFFAPSISGAADLPDLEGAPAQLLWSGFYVGVHGAYGWGDIQDISNSQASAHDIEGGSGGVQAGYNHSFSNGILIGAEADATLGAIGGNFDDRSVNQYSAYYMSDDIRAAGTLRLRVGYQAGPVVPYVTGGLAWGDVKHVLGCDRDRVDQTLGCGANGGRFETSASSVALGYTVGGGIESALGGKWSMKLEYLYTNLGSKVSLADPNFGPEIHDRDFDIRFSTIRLGLNYKL